MGLLLSLALFYPLIKLSSTYVVHKLIKPRLIAEKYSPLIINEFKMVLALTNSLHRATAFVADGGYPYVSSRLKEVLKRVNGGVSVENALLHYANYEAPPTIRNFLINFIKTPLHYSYRDLGLETKVKEIFLEDFRKLRINILILFSLGFLLPAPIIIALLTRGGQPFHTPTAPHLYIDSFLNCKELT